MVIGKFKDEAAGIPITEFIGLRSKMYSYVKDNGKNEDCQRCKKVYDQKEYRPQDYKDTLQNDKQIYHTMKTVRSVCHQLGSYELSKISLSCLDE